MKIKQFLLSLTDWELFKKPESTRLRESAVNNIILVDPEKWYHPKIPEGEVRWCGFIGVPGEDPFVLKHPDLELELHGMGSLTIAGKEKSITKKDREIIGKVFDSLRKGETPHKRLLSTNRILLSRFFELFVALFWLSFPLSFFIYLAYKFPLSVILFAWGLLIVKGLIEIISFLEKKFS